MDMLIITADLKGPNTPRFIFLVKEMQMDLMIKQLPSGNLVVIEYDHGEEVGKTGLEYFDKSEYGQFLTYLAQYLCKYVDQEDAWKYGWVNDWIEVLRSNIGETE
jgi:hypothetical protein